MIERELSYEHHFVGTFLTSSIVNFQAMKSTLANQQFGWAIKEIMRVNMRIDVRKLIKRRKSLTLPTGKTVFVHFEGRELRSIWRSYSKFSSYYKWCGQRLASGIVGLLSRDQAVFDTKIVGYKEEKNNPICSSDGLKRPQVQSVASGVSTKEDSIEVLGTLLQVPNSSRSAGLAKQASQAQ
ncbi:hypothetical protein Goari_022222 [Gossypium aridum]|uniref:Uncharacterized protein n=1 Tax=Gossypium aridum TaxID=34290 RepID=A0A7J8YSN9_GOSAI|nr:hypothetical protein [Gossypium aridum]